MVDQKGNNFGMHHASHQLIYLSKVSNSRYQSWIRRCVGEEKYCESKLCYLKTEHNNDPQPGLNTDCSIQSLEYT